MKKIFIISEKPFLEESLNSIVELSEIMNFSTYGMFKTGGDLYITEHKLTADTPQLLIKLPLKLSYLVGKLKNAFNNYNIPLDKFGELTLNLQKRVCFLDNQEIKLTEVECAILQQLHKFKDKGQSKEELSQSVLGYGKSVQSNSIENHIYKLRQKIRTAYDNELIITTKNGYLLNF